MSLTSFIAENDVKSWLKTNFPFKSPSLQPLPCIEPRTKRNAMIGIAFDYVLRFKLQHIHPNAVVKTWIAEHSTTPDVLANIARKYDISNAEAVEQAVSRARMHHAAYIISGKMSDDLLHSTIQLAQIDPFYRRGVLDIPFGVVDSEDINDLWALYNAIPAQLLTPHAVCLLNPAFACSELVGNADADVVLDTTLIDIKTTKYLKITREHINQLLGYYMLHRIGGIEGAPKKHQINTIGIYFARHSYLHTWPIADFVNPATYPELQEWFIYLAKQNSIESAYEGGRDYEDPEVEEYFRQVMERDD